MGKIDSILLAPSRIHSRWYVNLCKRVAKVKGWIYICLSIAFVSAVLSTAIALFLLLFSSHIPYKLVASMEAWQARLLVPALVFLVMPVLFGRRTVDGAPSLTVTLDGGSFASVHLAPGFFVSRNDVFGRFARTQEELVAAVGYCRSLGISTVTISSWLYTRRHISGEAVIRDKMLCRTQRMLEDSYPGASIQIVPARPLSAVHVLHLRLALRSLYLRYVELGGRPKTGGLAIHFSSAT